MSTTSWRGQIYRALAAIDCTGQSKCAAKQAQGWKPGQAIDGLYSFGYKNTVFDRAITFTNWLREEYPQVRLFREVYREMTAETCTPDTLRTLLTTLKKLQEGLWVMSWISEDIVRAEWIVADAIRCEAHMLSKKPKRSAHGLIAVSQNMVKPCASPVQRRADRRDPALAIG